MSDMKVFVISLKEAQSRRAAMRAQIEALGLGFEFFDAVDGRGFDVPSHPAYDAWRRRAFFGKDMTGGEIGCLLSHRGIYEKMVAENIEKAVVLEDDAILYPDFARVVEALARGGHSFDLVRFLGSEKVAKLRQRIIAPVTGEYTLNRICTTPGGAHAYMITLEGAKKMLARMGRNYLPVDTLMGHVWVTGMKAYIVQPGVALHDLAQESYIGDARFDKKGAKVRPFYYPLTRGVFKVYEGVMKRVSYGFGK